MNIQLCLAIVGAVLLCACSDDNQPDKESDNCALIASLENVQNQHQLIKQLGDIAYTTSETTRYVWEDAGTRQTVTLLDGDIIARSQQTQGTASEKLTTLPSFFTLEDIHNLMGEPQYTEVGDTIYLVSLNDGLYEMEFTVDDLGVVQGHFFYGSNSCPD